KIAVIIYDEVGILLDRTNKTLIRRRHMILPAIQDRIQVILAFICIPDNPPTDLHVFYRVNKNFEIKHSRNGRIMKGKNPLYHDHGRREQRNGFRLKVAFESILLHRHRLSVSEQVDMGGELGEVNGFRHIKIKDTVGVFGYMYSFLIIIILGDQANLIVPKM